MIECAQINQSTFEFTVTAVLRRNAFGGKGAPLESLAGEGSVYLIKARPGALPEIGDVIYEGVGGTRLLFGDGTDTSILCFKIVRVRSDNEVVAVAIDPKKWYRGLSNGEPTDLTITHTYTRSGTFTVSMCTAGGVPPNSRRNGLLHLAQTQVDAEVEAVTERGINDAVAFWQGCDKNGTWNVYSQRIADGSVRGDPRTVSTGSTNNCHLWASHGFLVYSGVNRKDGKRKIYCVKIDELMKGESQAVPIGPSSLVENVHPKIEGDWVLATGVDPKTGSREVWAANVQRRDDPRIVSKDSRNNNQHVAISKVNAIWSGWDVKDGGMHLYYQDLLNPKGPVRVSTNRTRMARASGCIYECLRCYDGFNPERKGRDVFFRTLPLVPDNPPVMLSTTSANSASPRMHGVQCVFEGDDPETGSRHLYYVADVTSATEKSRPRQLTKQFCTVWPNYIRPYLEDAYCIERDWVAWVGLNAKDGNKKIYAVNLKSEKSQPFLVSGNTIDDTQPQIRGNMIAWKGKTPESDRYDIYFANLDDSTRGDPPIGRLGADRQLLNNASPYIINQSR